MNDIEKANAEWIGKENMQQQLIEECGELIKAVCKVRRTRGIGQPTPVTVEEAEKKMCEEIADVLICIQQLLYLEGIDYQYIEALITLAVGKVGMRRCGMEI